MQDSGPRLSIWLSIWLSILPGIPVSCHYPRFSTPAEVDKPIAPAMPEKASIIVHEPRSRLHCSGTCLQRE
jgi:hypothetical protein